jgi:hypothetical protein
MVAERWSTQFNIGFLQDFLKTKVLSLQPTFPTPSFGGWSVLSSNGALEDGWHGGHKLWDKSVDKAAVAAELKSQNMKRAVEYVVPTEICQGYLKEVIEIISGAGFMPHRARITNLPAGKSSSWHQDCLQEHYGVRLHIPIFTNPECFFETETEKEHLVADGTAYLIYVNRMHRVVNGGTSDRYHLVMDVRDLKNASQFHRYEDFMKERERKSNS